jgi:transcriptional regulator with XRE-family HTH domain
MTKTTTKPATLAAQLLPHVQALGGTYRSRAERLDIAYAVLYRYENGTRVPTAEDLETIAHALGFQVVLERRQ